MREAAKNILSLGVPVYEAISMASFVPARAAGIERKYGLIKEGRRADLFAFDDEVVVGLAVANGKIALDKR
jgi:N-acetylglucosamine-6-phosphate deacetylase